jgi:hypothetical protein
MVWLGSYSVQLGFTMKLKLCYGAILQMVSYLFYMSLLLPA